MLVKFEGVLYKKISLEDRLPEMEKFVPLVDIKNQIIVYKRVEQKYFPEGWCWTMKEMSKPGINNILPMTHWLEEVNREAKLKRILKEANN